MILLNVSFGIFAFLPQGWIFMAFVMFIESLILSKFFEQKWFDKQIYGITFLTNIISGIIGIIASMKLNGGWWLVVWFPWVSNNEVDTTNPEALKWLYILYGCAFLLTIIIETLTNWLFLKKRYATKRILTVTLTANTVSYLIGTFVLYAYSFG